MSGDTATETHPSEFILNLPKAELHLHLEGAIAPATLLDLIHRHGDSAATLEQVQKLYEYSNFTGFLNAFKLITEHLRAPDDYDLITYRLMEQLQRENILHAEVYVSVGVCLWRKQDFDAIFEGLERGRKRGQHDFGVSLLWIFDATRHFGPDRAMPVVEKAIQYQQRNVVGFGIGGDERRAPPEHFREVYAYAAHNGLRLVAHAGETSGPESVLGALDALHAERIGHGLTAFQDRALMGYIVEHQVPLEVCVTSNLRTGCCKSLEQHPLKLYCDLGAMVTLNSDDPVMFGSTLAQEYQRVQDWFGMSDDLLRHLARNSFQASFLPQDQKDRFLALPDTQPPQG